MRHSCDLFMIDWHFLDIRQQTFTCIYHVMLWVQNKKELNEIMSKIFHFYLNEVNLIVFYSAYHISLFNQNYYPLNLATVSYSNKIYS